MEEVCSRNQNTLAGLMQGREFVNQLKIQFQLSNSTEKYELFVEKIESSFDNAIALINSMAFLEHETPSHAIGNTFESPNLLENSSKSEGLDPDCKDQTHEGVSKKRKMTRKWNDAARVFFGAGLESHLNDGYSWRKYGQKVILNTKHPRAYYRCTYLNTHRCLAKKHVQQTDDDPSIFEVVYKGEHSCVQETVNQNKGNFGAGNKEEEGVKHVQQMMVFSNDTRPGLKVETRELDVTDDAMADFPSFSFPSTPVGSEHSEDTPLFFDLSKDTNFIGSPFLSPATSESCFSFSQGQVNGFVIGNDLSSAIEYAEIVSSATTSTSTFEDLDLSIDQVDFDTKFLDAFDNFC